MRAFLVSLGVFIFFSESISAQSQYQFQHYGVDDGLSQIGVSGLEIDKTGHVWIATHKGLNRFDGSNFKIFQTPLDTLKNGLIFNEVSYTLEDTDGIIWVATRNGLSKYNPRTQLFTNFSKAGDCEQCLARPQITYLKEQGAFIYIATNGGLSRVHKQTHKITSWLYEEGKEHGPKKTSIREIEILADGRLLLITQLGISIFNPKDETFKHLTTKDGLPENKLQSIYKDSKNRYWIGCETQGLALLTGTWDAPSFKHYPPIPEKGPSHGFIYEITEDQHGTLWLATFNGVTLLDAESESFTYLYHNPNNEHSISSNQVFDIQRDAHNRMWVATISGLDVYDPYLNQFTFINSEKNNPKSLSSDKTFSIFEDSKGFLWIGNYENGVTVVRPNDTLEKYLHISNGTGKQQLSGPQVLGIEEDDEGNIWLATFNGINFINWPDRSTNNFSVSQVDLSAVPNNPHLSQYTYFVKKGENGAMWVGTHGAGLIKIEPNGNLKQFSFKDRPKGIIENALISMKIDTKDRIWVGTPLVGFAVIENASTQNYFTRIPGISIMAEHGVHKIICKDKDEIIMSSGVGIFHFNDKEELFKTKHPKYTRLTEADGLSDNVVYEIVQSEKDTYWISTGNGLTHWDTNTNTLTPYTKALGNKNLDFNLGASCIAKNGRLYFGSTSGVVHFNPTAIFKNAVAPNVYFSDFRILNEPVPIATNNRKTATLPKALRYLEKITLKPQDKIISFKISNVNHTLPKKTTYAYKLDGFETDWTHTKNPIITRSNLEPGNYTLLAKAANNDGVWSEPISLTIEMLPPWYRTWWAYILFALLIAGSIYLLLKLRLQQERRLELARAQERDIFRKRSSRDFHDEAGTKITRISLITELARIENAENKALQDHLHQIEENVQDLNSGMRDFIWTLDPTKDNAYDTLTRYTEFAGKFCEYANIQFKSDTISEVLKTKELNMAERRHLLMILKEATNNCVKHGKPTVLKFSITHKPGSLKLTLKDNGNGFDPMENTKGNGLSNMRERAEALGGALKIDSKTNGGTTLTLSLETTRLGN